MQQSGVYDLLKLLEMAIEESFSIIPGRYTIVKDSDILTLIDRIYASMPTEVQEAQKYLKRIEEVKIAAQQEAEKIITDAQAEADRKLSEADFIKAVEREGIRIRNQVQEECEELKRKALEEADEIRSQAQKDADKTKEGAELYAEQVLTNLETDLSKLQQVVKNGQIYMEQLRTSSGSGSSYYNSNSTNNTPAKTPDFVIQ